MKAFSFQPGDGTDGRSTVFQSSILTIVRKDGSQEDWRADAVRNAKFPPAQVRLRQVVDGVETRSAIYVLAPSRAAALAAADEISLTPAMHESAVVVWVCAAVGLAAVVAAAVWGCL